MIPESVKLEPCPFCGARLVHSDGLSTRRELAFVHDRDDDDPCIMASVFVMGEERVQAWNRRASRLTRQEDETRRAALEEAAETADREIRRAWARWIGSVDGGALTVRLCLKSAHEMQNVPAAIRALKEAGHG